MQKYVKVVAEPFDKAVGVLSSPHKFAIIGIRPDGQRDLLNGADDEHKDELIKLYSGELTDGIVWFKHKLESFGFTITDESDDLYNAQVYTPAGEDWNITFSDIDNFIDYAESFDVDEEFELLFTADLRGKPSASVLLKDQQWKKRFLTKIINNIKRTRNVSKCKCNS